MATLFNDTFTDSGSTKLSAHTPDTGTSWSLIFDTELDGSELQMATAGTTLDKGTGGLSNGFAYEAVTTYGSADYEVSVDVVNADTGDDPGFLFVRIQSSDIDNSYALRFNEDFAQMYKVVTGTWTAVGADGGTLIVGTDKVTLKIVGTTLSYLVNDVEQESVTVSDHSGAGRAGLGMGAVLNSGDDCSGQEYDNYIVDGTAAGGGGGGKFLSLLGVGS